MGEEEVCQDRVSIASYGVGFFHSYPSILAFSAAAISLSTDKSVKMCVLTPPFVHLLTLRLNGTAGELRRASSATSVPTVITMTAWELSERRRRAFEIVVDMSAMRRMSTPSLRHLLMSVLMTGLPVVRSLSVFSFVTLKHDTLHVGCQPQITLL